MPDFVQDCLWASERRLVALSGGVSGEAARDALAASEAAAMDGAA